MATLKSLKNKYLTVADGTVLGVTTNTENISALSFKLATADSLSKFNLVDGFADDYNDATGVDASSSTNETRDSSGKYYSGAQTGTIQAFTTVGNTTWTPANSGDAEILVVAGGGGGGGSQNSGGSSGGAGGAGGVVHHATYTVVAATEYDLTIGDKGNGRGKTNEDGYNGGNSSFNNNNEGSGSKMTAVGGGGGSMANTPNNGLDGGSGGGGGNRTSSGSGGSGTQGDSGGGTGYGNDGGSGSNSGGGGGADTAGGNSTAGAGKLFSTFVAYGTDSNNVASTGSNGGYFAGGGGGKNSNGGVGGGGNGPTQTASHGTPALANTGGGGNGSWDEEGGSGGTGGIFILNPDTYNNMTLASTAYTAQTDPTTIRIVMDEYTSTGSSTLNTDIKAYASRDNGTTYTQITLADQGTIETNHRLLSGSVDISAQPSGTSVKYKIETLNQTSGKQTRVYGTSMAWA